MKPITTETLATFRPTYPEYERRRLATADKIGVESLEDLKNYREHIEKWNEESAIGFEKAEMNVTSLILSEEEANIRFNKNSFIHPGFGGNTAEHPLFIGHKIDSIRDAAGFGPGSFLKHPHTLEAARIAQALHSRAAMHDIGELIDISHTEAKITGATCKEPPEEALVGPFKILLASYAISTRQPMLYIHTMYEARKRIQAAKADFFEEARSGAITGDAFVAKVGREIAAIIDETTHKLEAGHGPLQQQLRPEYREANASLTEIFEQSQSFTGFEGALFNFMDKYEGDSHYRHFIGRPKTEHQPHTPIMERMFNNGNMLSYHMASSAQVISSLKYAQKTLPPLFTEAEALENSAERETALTYARAGAAALLRNHIRILAKSPPLLDTSSADNSDAKLTADETEQGAHFRRRLDIQRSFQREWDARLAAHQGPWTQIDGIVSRDLLIAVFDKAATAIEEGRFTPAAGDIPLCFGTLPAALQVNEEDIARSQRKYQRELTTFVMGG